MTDAERPEADGPVEVKVEARPGPALFVRVNWVLLWLLCIESAWFLVIIGTSVFSMVAAGRLTDGGGGELPLGYYAPFLIAYPVHILALVVTLLLVLLGRARTNQIRDWLGHLGNFVYTATTAALYLIVFSELAP